MPTYLIWSISTVLGSAFTPARPQHQYYVLDSITPRVPPELVRSLRTTEYLTRTGSFALDVRAAFAILPETLSLSKFTSTVVFLTDQGLNRLRKILLAHHNLKFKPVADPAKPISPSAAATTADASANTAIQGLLHLSSASAVDDAAKLPTIRPGVTSSQFPVPIPPPAPKVLSYA